MSRYIDVDLAIDEIIKDMCGIPDVDEGIHTAISELRLMPIEDVRENVKGEWIEDGALTKCSVCGNTSEFCGTENFCYNCGADMRGGTE